MDEEQHFTVLADGLNCEPPSADFFYEWGSWITFHCRADATAIEIRNTYPGHLAFCGIEVYGTHEYGGEREEYHEYSDDEREDYNHDDWREPMPDYYDNDCDGMQHELDEVYEMYFSL